MSKTLRFELKPVGNTLQMLEDENVFEKDRVRKEKYKQTKSFFDRLHRQFIIESLTGKTIDGLDKYFTLLKKLEKDKKDKALQKEFKTLSEELRTQLNNHFQTEALFGVSVFEELKKRYGKEEGSFLKDKKDELVLDEEGNKISIFDEWKGFTGYFDKFQETRKNFYKDDGTSTAVVTRIIDQNLKRFCENTQLFKDIKYKIDFSEVEKTLSVDLGVVFSLEYYNSCLLQDGIDTYNKILGGEVVKDTNEKLKGLNEIINKYRQDHKDEKISFFKLLDKQILSEKEDFIENIEDDKELLQRLREFYISAEEKTEVLKTLLGDFFLHEEEYELDKVFLSKEGLNTILHRWMTDNGRDEFQKVIYEQTKKDKIVKFEKSDNSYRFPDFIALSLIKNALAKSFEEEKLWKDKYLKNEEDSKSKGFLSGEEPKWEQFIKIFESEFNSLFENEYQELIGGEERQVKKGYNVYKKDFEEIINRNESDFSVSSEDKLTIKNFVDSTLWIYQMGKYFALEKKRQWVGDEYDIDTKFYHHPDFGFKKKFYDDAYGKLIKVRMLLQSYLTKKPFSTDKWKLTFENPTLADGWDKNKEPDNSAVILRKDGRYYLAVMQKGHNKVFDDGNIQASGTDSYEKMVYKSISDPVKDIPNLMVIDGRTVRKTGRKDKKTGINHRLEELKDEHLPKEISDIRKSSSYLKTSENFNQEDSQKYLAFYMQRLIEYKKGEFDFEFKKPEEYGSYAEFLDDVGNQGYKIDFVGVSSEYIKNKNTSGELFLFEIHNKDWGSGPKDKNRKRTKNLHSMYFDTLFSKENAESNFPFKLNGEAELFYRPKTDEEKLGYKVKNTKTGKWKNIVVKKSESVPEEAVVDHKRYLKNKTFLHVPITLNRTADDSHYFNQKVNEFLLNNPEINVIGLDRGEKHLIYYAGIDQKCNLLKDKNGNTALGSLNEINGVNYHKLLEERAKGREKARQDWQNIENIKDLKKGYISLVVRKLADLIIEHNAIIVFEDLNMRFKQIRGGIEKSVYQQLEKVLIKKLNFLVNKGEKDPQKAGHLLRAFQLTAPFITFKDMGKQTGVIFYTQASYTSKTCPECGFRPNVKWDQDGLMEKINITFTENNFKIAYKASDFLKQKNSSKRGNRLYADKKGKDEFILSTKNAIRYKWFSRNKKDFELKKGEERMLEQTENGITIKYDITECLKGLLEEQDIDYKNNIVKQISEKVATKKFFTELAYYLYLLSNTRSSVSGTNIDQINCPHCGFHSDKKFNGVDFNGDANGAYNIARKGVMILEKINQYHNVNKTLDKMNWGDLFIDIEEWDKHTQD